MNRPSIIQEYYEGCERVVKMEQAGEITGPQAGAMICDLHEHKEAQLARLTASRRQNTEEDDEDGETLGSEDTYSDDSDSDYTDSFIDDDEDEDEEDEDDEDEEEEDEYEEESD